MVVKVVKVVDFRAFKTFLEANKKEFYKVAMDLVVQDVIKGIDEQIDATGQPFPPLAPSTIKRKKHDKALIDKGLLRQDYTYRRTNKYRQNLGTITIEPRTKGGDTPRDEVAVYLQDMGVPSKTGKKFFRFFGITRDAEERIYQLVDILIEDALKAT